MKKLILFALLLSAVCTIKTISCPLLFAAAPLFNIFSPRGKPQIIVNSKKNAAMSGQSIALTSRLGNFKISPITEYGNIIESSLRNAQKEVQDHIQGKIDLPLAKDIVF